MSLGVVCFHKCPSPHEGSTEPSQHRIFDVLRAPLQILSWEAQFLAVFSED